VVVLLINVPVEFQPFVHHALLTRLSIQTIWTESSSRTPHAISRPTVFDAQPPVTAGCIFVNLYLLRFWGLAVVYC
jgi:hypothetical protein